MAGQMHCTITETEKARIPTADEKAFLESGASLAGIDIDNIPSGDEKSWLTAQQSGSLTGVSAAEAIWVTANATNHALTDAEYANVPTDSEKEFLEAVVAEDSEAYCNLGAPIAADPDRITVSVSWADGAQILAAQPDVPRNVTAALTDENNSVTGTLTITGLDPNGVEITETMSPAGDGNGKTLTGTKIFASITSAVIAGTAGAAAEDVLVIGVGNLIGLPMDISNVNQVSQVLFNGTAVATPTLTSGVSTSGINAAALSLNGVKVLEAYVTGTLLGTIGSNIPSSAQKAWLNANVTKQCLTADQVSHLPSHDEKALLTAEQVAGHTGLTVAEHGYLPSADEKTWLTTQQSGSLSGITAAEITRIPTVNEAALIEALLTGGSSFFIHLGAPIAATAIYIAEAVDWANGALAIAHQPDVPRNITIALTDANNSCTGTITVVGTDMSGRAVSETMAPDGAGNGKALTGTKIFKTITSITITDAAGTEAGVDQVSVGQGTVIGVPVDLAAAAEVPSVLLGGAVVAVPVLSTGESTSGVDASASVYNGTKVLDVVIQLGLI